MHKNEKLAHEELGIFDRGVEIKFRLMTLLTIKVYEIAMRSRVVIKVWNLSKYLLFLPLKLQS